MAERFKAAVLKTVERKLRGFESLSLRHVNSCTEYNVQSIKYREARLTQNAVLCTSHVSNGEVAERLKAAAC
jgi:RIO-like serine/threonine protein kinase